MTHPQPAPDLSAWLTKQQAATRIQVSTKTIEKLAADGKLHTAKRPNNAGPAIAVYHPQDVERIANERHPPTEPFLVPRTAVSELPEARRSDFLNPLYPLSQLIAEGLREGSRSEEKPLFVSIAEASRLTGLTQRYLKNEIRADRLPVVKDGRRARIRRKDLEGL